MKVLGGEGAARLLPCNRCDAVTSEMGQDLALGDVDSMSGLTESGHDWPIYELAVIFPGKFPAMAGPDRTPRTQRRCRMVDGR